MKSIIYLIRHGQTEGNEKRVFYGASDLPLTKEGIEDLERMVEKGIYPKLEDADCYTTGLLRTEQTFSLIFGDKDHSKLEALQEMRFGEFEMKTHEELMGHPQYKGWIEDKTGTLASPKGESIVGFNQRIQKGFAELRKHHAKKENSRKDGSNMVASAIVCHGGTIASIMEDCFPGGQEHFFKWIPDPGHGYALALEDGAITAYRSF